MYPQTVSNPTVANTKRLFVVVLVLIVLGCLFELFIVFHTVQTTGVVQLTSSDNTATLSISQADHEAKVIGTGSAKVHIAPGAYIVSASDNGYQATSIVQVQQKESTFTRLTLAPAATSTSSSKLLDLLPFIGPAASYQIATAVQTNNNITGPVIIITSANTQAQQAALQWIRDQGFDPANYTIQYQTSQITDYHYSEGLPQ